MLIVVLNDIRLVMQFQLSSDPDLAVCYILVYVALDLSYDDPPD